MNKSRSAKFQSALIVNKYVFLAAFILSLIAWWLSADAIAALLLTLSFVGVVSYLWGHAALTNIKAVVKADSAVLSVGQTTDITYEIENDKIVPLVWLELCQKPPFNGCMEPDQSMTVKKFSEMEAEERGVSFTYSKRFAFLLGHGKLSWKCTWTGRKRGIYRIEDLLLKSGDGFGLTQSELFVDNPDRSVFAVWPKIVPVRTEALFKNVWSGRTGKKGWVEDPTILLGEREYIEGDSWKRIDWRSAARTDELYTKQFETIKPESFLFIIDTFSFDDKEEALSIAASIIYELNLKHTGFGIVLPETERKECIIRSIADDLYETMFDISEHDEKSVKEEGFNLRRIVSAVDDFGQVFIITQNEVSKRSSAIAASLAFCAPKFICAEETNGAISFDMIKEADR